jgi:hypothetical protein
MQGTPSPVSRPLAPRGVNSATKKGGPYSTSRENILTWQLTRATKSTAHAVTSRSSTGSPDDKTTPALMRPRRSKGSLAVPTQQPPRPAHLPPPRLNPATSEVKMCYQSKDLALTLGIKINKKHGLEARFSN